MKVKAIQGFDDLKAKVFRDKGAVFECDEKRFEELNGTQYGQLVEKVAAKRGAKKAE